MKKLIALLMVALLLTACTAMADTTKIVEYDDGLNVTVTLPDGYEMDSFVEQGVMMSFVSKDEDSLSIMMLVAGDSIHDDVSKLNDLSAEEKEAFVNDLAADMANTVYEIKESGHGTEIVVLRDQNEEADLAVLATLYNGYDIIMYVSYADGRAMTDEDMTLAMQFMTDMNFTTELPQ